MKRVAAVSFDAHGTLFHAPRLASVYADVFSRHGSPASEDHLRRGIATAWQELSCRARLGEDRFTSHDGGSRGFWSAFVRRVAELTGVDDPGPFAAAELWDRFGRADAWELFGDVVPTLDGLASSGIRRGVVSNFDERLPGLLEDLGIGDRFDAVVFSSDVGVEKPHPAIFEELLDRLGLPAASVAHVGDDRRHDVEGAEAVGLEALLIDRSGEEGDLDRLDRVLEIFAPAGPAGPRALW